MTADDLTSVLQHEIPLARAMQITVLQADPTCTLLSAPLAPNINHMGTLFGGSANTLATLAAWSLLYLRLEEQQPPCHIIIQRGLMHYRQPVTGDALARCQFDDTARWARFARTLERHGRARLTLHAEILENGLACALFEGDFVAVCAD